MKKIAILTCAEMPEMLPYDQEVQKILIKRGFITDVLIWDEVLKLSRTHLKQYDLVLIRTIWDYYKKTDEFNDFLVRLEDENINVLNPVDIIRWNMDKKYLMQLESEGYDIIPTIFNFAGEDSFSLALDKGWEKAVLKPMISAGSYDTFVLDMCQKAKFDGLIEQYFQNRPYMLQEFVSEIALGEISTITFTEPGKGSDVVLSYSIKKVPKEGDYRVQNDFGGVYSLHEVDAKIKQLSHKITTRFNDRLLYQRLDGIWRNGKFLIMELELVEPDLYLNFSKQALNQWVGILERILNKN